jgi:hypothetical protein
MTKEVSRPCSKTISGKSRRRQNQRLESDTDFFTHACECQAESFSEAGFQWCSAKLCERFAKLCAVVLPRCTMQ